MSHAVSARRTLVDEPSAVTSPAAARRALAPEHPRPRISLRLGGILVACGFALAGTAGLTIASVPQTTAHGAISTAADIQRGNADGSVSRSGERPGTGGAGLDDRSATEDQSAFEARTAELETRAAAVRGTAAAGYLQRFAEQQSQRAKEPTKVTPAHDATPTDGFATLIYPDAAAQAAARYVAPIAAGSYVLSASYGATGSWNPYHNGQDFAAPAGTPVYAVTDALVGVGIPEAWPGNHVVLHLASGESLLYAHLSDAVVQPGQIVHAGDLIGHVGNTGRSFGAHLHFEYYPNGIYAGDFWGARDSLAWLRQHGVEA